jgi:hypothetical protein
MYSVGCFALLESGNPSGFFDKRKKSGNNFPEMNAFLAQIPRMLIFLMRFQSITTELLQSFHFSFTVISGGILHEMRCKFVKYVRISFFLI